MSSLTSFLFDTSQWPPRWYCGHWTDALGYTHIVSDSLIFLAYFAIPCVLLYFISKVKGFSLERIFILFALFIVCCGLGHLIEAIIFYYPVYRFSGLVKALTAIVSWMTVFALIPYIKKLAEFPQLKLVNKKLSEQLKAESERLKATNKELKKNKSALEDFAHHVAHDLKEPLRGMGAYATIVLELEKENLSAEGTEKLTKLKTLSTRSIDMIENMLKYSMNDHEQLVKDTLEIEGVVKNLMEEFYDADNNRAIKINGKLPIITANSTTMKEVLRNLISNGFKYNDHHEKVVEIGCHENGEDFVFYVKDNGQGIRKAEQTKVFDLFYRGGNSINKDSTGLGLGIAKKYIENHGGKIWLESEEGKGTTFYFSIPKLNN